MSFTIQELMKMSVMKKAELFSGKEGTDNEIKGITIIEAPDIADWIKGGEILVTSLYAYKNISLYDYEDLMNQVFKKKISAMILKLGRFVDIDNSVLPLIESLSNTYKIPVIKIPMELPYRDVVSTVMQKLFNEEVIRLKYFKETYDQFASLSQNNLGNEKILYVLEQLIGNPIILFDGDSNCISYKEMDCTNYIFTSDLMKYDPPVFSKHDYFRQKVKIKTDNKIFEQLVIPVDIGLNAKMTLKIVERERQLDILDYIAIESAITFLLIESSKLSVVQEIEKKFKNDILEEILSGKIKSKQIMYQRASLIGLNLDSSYYVMVFKIIDQSQNNNIEYNQQHFEKESTSYSILYDLILLQRKRVAIQKQNNKIVVIWDMEENNGDNSVKIIKNSIQKIEQALANYNSNMKLKVGLSNKAKDILGVSTAYKEALDALSFRKAIGSEQSVISFSELGIFRLLCQFDDQEELEKFIPDSLKDLLNYKQPSKKDLLETLETYLKQKQNVTKTSQELFVHYKTVIYRIERIVEITGINFDDSEEVLSMQLGLKILKLIENYNDNDI